VTDLSCFMCFSCAAHQCLRFPENYQVCCDHLSDRVIAGKDGGPVVLLELIAETWAKSASCLDISVKEIVRVV